VHVLRGMGRTVSVPVNPAAPGRQVVAPQCHERGFQPRGRRRRSRIRAVSGPGHQDHRGTGTMKRCSPRPYS
jgi:hypothetical protein